MIKRLGQLIQAGVLFGVIVLPHAYHAEHLDQSISRGRSIENAFIVADAAERFAEANGGIYPALVASLAHYLTGEQPLMNAYTGWRTEPVDGAAAASGAIGYVPIAQSYYNIGYTITAFGRNATVGQYGDGIVLMLQKVTDPPAPTRE